MSVVCVAFLVCSDGDDRDDDLQDLVRAAIGRDLVMRWCPKLENRSVGEYPDTLHIEVTKMEVPKAMWWERLQKDKPFFGTATIKVSTSFQICDGRVAFTAMHGYRDASYSTRPVGRHGRYSEQRYRTNGYTITEIHSIGD